MFNTLSDARFDVHVGVAAAACQSLAASLCMAAVFQITRLQTAPGELAQARES